MIITKHHTFWREREKRDPGKRCSFLTLGVVCIWVWQVWKPQLSKCFSLAFVETFCKAVGTCQNQSPQATRTPLWFAGVFVNCDVSLNLHGYFELLSLSDTCWCLCFCFYAVFCPDQWSWTWTDQEWGKETGWSIFMFSRGRSPDQGTFGSKEGGNWWLWNWIQQGLEVCWEESC